MSYQTLITKDLQNPVSLEDLGYNYFGPLVFNFFYWLKDEVNNGDLVLFNSREGYFLEEIYNIFKPKYNLPESVYFKTSRKLSSISSFKTEEDIYDSFKLHRFNGTLGELMKNRFNVEIDDNTPIDTTIELPNLTAYINKILKKSNNLNINYKEYIDNIIKNKKNVYMVDSGYQGSTQYYLQKAFNLNLKGRYITYKANLNLNNTKGLYDFEKYNFKNNIIFFESVFTDKVGTYSDIVDGQFINETNSENQLYFEDKVKIINGIKNYIEDIFHTKKFTDISLDLSDFIFNLMCTNGFVKNNSLFQNFYHDNTYVRSEIKKIQQY